MYPAGGVLDDDSVTVGALPAMKTGAAMTIAMIIKNLLSTAASRPQS